MAGLKYRVKNWSKFQHYKNRNPPWIRLHVEILDDYKADGTENDFHALPDKDKLTLMRNVQAFQGYRIPALGRMHGTSPLLGLG